MSKPIKRFLNTAKISSDKDIQLLSEENYLKVDKNLYVVTHQLINKKIMEIEDLFTDEVLNVKIHNKTFNRKDNFDRTETFGKARFADYVSKNYKIIDFKNFKKMLDIISTISNPEIDKRL